MDCTMKAPEDEFLKNMPHNYYILKMDVFRAMLKQPEFVTDSYLLDLRNAEKHAENGIPGSVQCLIRDLPENYRRLLPDRNKKIIILCGSGQMSMYAVMYLKIKGYREVWSLAGGFNKYASEVK